MNIEERFKQEEQIREQVRPFVVKELVNRRIEFSDANLNHIVDIASSIIYTRDGLTPGGAFVQAVVNNNLSAAVSAADWECQKALPIFVVVKEWFRPKFT